PLSVNFGTSGTADAGGDYNSLIGPVLIPAGASSAALNVVVVDDAVREGDETVILTLSAGLGYVIGTPSSATVRILDNDNNPPLVTITSPAEGFLTSFPAIITLAAFASDPDGSVARVEYFDNGTNRIGQSAISPYIVFWTNGPAGVHTLTAMATDNLGSSAISPPVGITINARPTVSFLSPPNGSIISAGTNITLVADASDSDGVVMLVEFFQGTNFLGNDISAPYTFLWAGVPAGEYTLTARATDDRGASTDSAPIVITVGTPASRFGDNFAQRGVMTGFASTITGNSTTFTREPGEPRHDSRNGTHSGWITWTAPASGLCVMDTTGSDFDTVLAVYTNAVLANLARVASNDDANQDTATSQLSFNTIAGMVYQIAIDGFSSNAYGNFVFHCALPNPYPVFLVQPQSQVTTQGMTVTFSAQLGGPTPQRYQWRFNNGNLAGETNTVLVRTNVSGANAGNYTLVATNSSGATTSAVATLTVRTTATLATQPADAFIQPGDSASFFVRATGFGPFTYQWRFNGTLIPGATASNLVLSTAYGRDAGAYSVLVSNPIGTVASRDATLSVNDGLYLTVITPIFALSNQVWRYQVQGEDLGTAWRQPGYDDSGWSNGMALFGLETTPQAYSDPFRTVFPINTTNGVPITNFYFRTGFTLDDPRALSGLLVTAYVDDGAVWYVNGREAARLRVNNAIPVDAVPYTTIATNLNTEGVPSFLVLPATNAVAGTNLMQVELHQGTIPSSDAVFGMSLDALMTLTNPPSVALSDFKRGNVTITLTGIAGRNYAIDCTPDMVHWTNLTVFTNFDSTSASMVTPVESTGNRFYRGRVAQ
ncbi:MAG TPA: Ig-like domain-containing protein, partial [Candidatus Saccharimonadales bacterium]|nr:Ig-like domain-containing protein [Candidatus Saccharimonadales bacterium]